MNEWMHEWMTSNMIYEKNEYCSDLTEEKYDEWMNEWMRVIWSMKKMSYDVNSNIFCDFSLERDRPTNQPTNRQSLL